LIANKYWNTQKDVKLWYFDRCWRYERPQMGRYREFFQFGVEWINPRNIEEAKKELSTESKRFMALAGIKEGDKKFLKNESFSENNDEQKKDDDLVIHEFEQIDVELGKDDDQVYKIKMPKKD
jgi:histidyl-tRNA synthetase